MGITRRLEDARKAYLKGDKKGSALAHRPEWIAGAFREESGRESHQYIGDLVYGGLDGIITTFAIVSGIAGARLDANIILIMGLANLFADGISMAVGAYLSSKSEQEYYEREVERETRKVENFPDGKRLELYDIYRNDGYSEDDAARLVEIKTRDRGLWIKTMMIDKQGLLPDERKPVMSGVATFIAFLMAGSLPLLVYLIGLFAPLSHTVAFPISLGLSGLGLFGVGAAKVFVTGRNAVRSGLEMLLVGGLAAGVAYGVGALLQGLGR
jgi:vacuolar iron transporter family protein